MLSEVQLKLLFKRGDVVRHAKSKMENWRIGEEKGRIGEDSKETTRRICVENCLGRHVHDAWYEEAMQRAENMRQREADRKPLQFSNSPLQFSNSPLQFSPFSRHDEQNIVPKLRVHVSSTVSLIYYCTNK